MNDGAKIAELQNTDRAINLLAAQRQLHSDAKALYWVYGIAATVPPVLACVVPNLSAIPMIACVILPVVSGRILTSLAEKRQREAASIQQEIDSCLYGIAFPNTEHDERLAARRGRRYLMKEGASELLDWYRNIDGLPTGRAEYECQKTNICWTMDIATVTLLIDLGVAAIATTIATLGIKESGANAIAYVLLTPIIVWIVECVIDRWCLRHATKRIKDSMEDLWEDDERHVKKAQDRIFEYRCRRPVPDFVYGLTKDAEQQRVEARL